MIRRTKTPAAPMAPTRFHPILLMLFRRSRTIFPLEIGVDNRPPADQCRREEDACQPFVWRYQLSDQEGSRNKIDVDPETYLSRFFK